MVTSAKPAASRVRKQAASTKGAAVRNAPGSEGPHIDKPFPIVGIGASAGGLEALEQFFSHIPAQSGMAFVVVLHLDPNRQDMMPELLQRATRMEVLRAKNRTKVKPDCVYVIPPNKDMSLRHGMLYLLEPAAAHGLRLPIDFFFRTLAEDQRERSVGVILSGMGSDGTLGVRAIKENAGLVLVQEPRSAKFDPMPQSVINAGLADIVASAEELPEKIAGFVRHEPPSLIAAGQETVAQKGALDKIIILLRARTGHDFSLYKKSTIYRRIERRMSLYQIARIADYVHFLRENPQEADLLFKELLIGVTNFFRDPAAWNLLQEQVLPALLAASPNGKTLRAWVVGCSTGEEAYSLAIAFRETVERIKPQNRINLQIFATDLDADAIERARRGYYPANIAADVSAERLTRFFLEEAGGYRVSKKIRDMVVFATQNVIMDPPFTKLEILTCRNLLIYLGQELQKRLLPLFHYCLNPGGVLFLGSAESLGSFTNRYTPLDAKARLYWRNDSPARPVDVEFPSRSFPAQSTQENEMKTTSAAVNIETLASQLLLQHFSPPAVLVNAEGDILYISGRTGKYLEPAAGKANWNVHAMAREGLRLELALTLPKVLRDKGSITRSGLLVGTNGGTQSVRLTVHAVEHPDALRGMAMIVFNDEEAVKPEPTVSSKRVPARGRVAELEQTLQQARAELQNVREEMQTQQEELRSANEELQSTNEELQSTNEELTTSKEEMQSLNEELQTVNAELQSKVEDLSTVNSDMKNLLNSTDIATVFLDNILHVRRFTDQATKVFKLIPADVGRALSDIVTDLEYSGLQDDAQEVLRTLVYSEKQIPTRDGRWFQVRIMPYRALDNMIDGVVITFSDISNAKHLEAELRKALAKSEQSGVKNEGEYTP